MRRRVLSATGISLLAAGCAVGPDYKRPAIDAPTAFRGTDAAVADAQPTRTLAGERWWELFQDPVLQQLIRKALGNNYDVRIAASRVLQAQAQLGVTRADQLPSLSAGGSALAERFPAIPGVSPAYRERAGGLDLSVVWNLDFWGRYRRATEAARAQLTASEWGRKAVLAGVVSDVATAYFRLRALDASLTYTQSTLESRQRSLHLTQVLASHGSASQLDVHQAEQLLYTSTETIADLERQIAQAENALSILLGENPRAIERGQALTQQPLPVTVPAGLPADLLERRPDIRQAEATLVAANAQVGVAKAAFFPSISLTGSGGYQSNALSTLFNQGSQLWNAAASVTQPIFQGGAILSGYRFSKAQKEEMLLTYRQTVQNAFREVADALIGYQKNRVFREEQQKLTAATRETDRLSNVLYTQGGASYLQVLTAETNEFAAELNLVQARLNERLALVQLYNALGGGWELE